MGFVKVYRSVTGEKKIFLDLCVSLLILLFCFSVQAKTREINGKLLRAVAADDLNRVRKALEEGADPNALSTNKAFGEGTPLHFMNDPEIVRVLLEEGADPDNREGRHGKAPLHYATFEVSKLLLNAGADPDAEDVEGNTPLFTNTGAPEKIQLLYEEGADPHHTDKFGRTAYESTVRAIKITDEILGISSRPTGWGGGSEGKVKTE